MMEREDLERSYAFYVNGVYDLCNRHGCPVGAVQFKWLDDRLSGQQVISAEDFQFTIGRLNGVAGTLMNHADGVKAITPEKARELYDTVVAVSERLRSIREK